MIVVTTDAHAAYLVESLPNVGLTGTAVDEDVVHIYDLAGSDPEDVKYELEEYGDRFGIKSVEVRA